jgi:hypothetical protein
MPVQHVQLIAGYVMTFKQLREWASALGIPTRSLASTPVDIDRAFRSYTRPCLCMRLDTVHSDALTEEHRAIFVTDMRYVPEPPAGSTFSVIPEAKRSTLIKKLLFDDLGMALPFNVDKIPFETHRDPWEGLLLRGPGMTWVAELSELKIRLLRWMRDKKTQGARMALGSQPAPSTSPSQPYVQPTVLSF